MTCIIVLLKVAAAESCVFFAIANQMHQNFDISELSTNIWQKLGKFPAFKKKKKPEEQNIPAYHAIQIPDS